nr:RNA-directed DNA polymerase, eukaryota, reverse transcriptase zinc-binding domain protein [Tanacetum cinerariifolium]
MAHKSINVPKTPNKDKECNVSKEVIEAIRKSANKFLILDQCEDEVLERITVEEKSIVDKYEIKVEDINWTGLHFTWIQSRLDPGNEILKKIDRVLGTSIFDKFISINDAEWMIRLVSNEEIKRAMFDMDNNKAPILDGFSSKFYKQSWEFIGKDVCDVVKEFFNKGKMLREINATSISLILKMETPIKVSDFRPIAFLCHDDVKSVKVVRDALNNFCSMSGLRPNIGSPNNLKIVSWNVRGMCNSKKQTEIRSLNVNDHSASLSCKTVDMLDFQECLKEIEVEDINWIGLHFTWIQSRLDPGNGILKKIDRVLGTSIFDKFISVNDAEWMIRLVSNEEIKRDMFDMDNNRAPIPDGFSSKFYKQSWEFIGKDVCDVVKEFFNKGKMLREINATSISLILKMETPIKVSDFRPIACYNSSTIKVVRDALNNFCSMSGLRPNIGKSTVFFRNLKDHVKKKFLSNKESLWVKWINEIRLKGQSIWKVGIDPNTSASWKQILSLRDKIKSHIVKKIRDGKTSFTCEAVAAE